MAASGPTDVRADITRRGNKVPHTLYVLDELDQPKVGLHMADVDKLIQVLHRLVDGGKILAAGTPEELVAAGTHTGVALAPVLARSGA